MPHSGDKCNFYMIFIILLFIKIVSFPLFLLIWFDFYLYLSIHLYFEEMRRFQINLQGLYMQSGASWTSLLFSIFQKVINLVNFGIH